MNEHSAQQRAALVTMWLLTEGPLTVATVAARLYETKSSAWRLLNEIGGVLPVINDGGWWYFDTPHLSDVRRIHELCASELEYVPFGMAYVRPFKRADVVRIHALTGELLSVGLRGAQLPDATLEEEFMHEEI